MAYCYTYTSVHHSVLIREAAETHSWTMLKVRDSGKLSPKWVVFFKPSPVYVQGYMGKRMLNDCKSWRWLMIPRKQHLPDQIDS